jgi:hypothetical protein
MEVLTQEGRVNHLYRLLRLWRSVRELVNKTDEAYMCTLEAGRVYGHPAVWHSLGRASMQTVTVFTHRKPTQRHQQSEMLKGLSGSAGPGMPRAKRC